MLVNWEYVYKRRGWSTKTVFDTLDQKTWEAFESFHVSKGIQSPPKQDFEKLLSAHLKSVPSAPVPVKEIKPEPVKRKRNYTRKKGVTSDKAEKRKKQ